MSGLIASRRHLLIMLGIAAAIAVAGWLQAQPSPGARDTGLPRITLYLVLIAALAGWVRYVQVGMRARGHSIAEFFTGSRGAAGAAMDLGLAAVGIIAARFAAQYVRGTLGGEPPHTGFLLPTGVVESGLWFVLSAAAGLGEEIVFRGYFQRQLAAVSGGKAAAGVLLQAVVFGVSHGYQGAVAMVSTGAYGIVLGLVAWVRGNVRACAVIHTLTDVVGGLWR